jgi:general stress protein YciG
MSEHNKELSPEAAQGIPQSMFQASSERESPEKKRIRGFAGMDENKKRNIASLGGKAAHLKGTAHQFTREEAKAAGKKGGEARSRRLNSEREMKHNANKTGDTFQ